MFVKSSPVRIIARDIVWGALLLPALACGGAHEPLAPTAPSSMSAPAPPPDSAAPGTLSVRDDISSTRDEDAARVELEGRIDAIDRAALRFTLSGRTVRVTNDTEIRHGSRPRTFDDLGVGDRVHVKGTVDGVEVLATRIEMQNPDDEREVDVAGIVSDLDGTCPNRQFQFGSQRIFTDSGTTFARGRCADLREGQRVEVNGFFQADGSTIRALRVKLPEPSEPPDDDDGDGGTGGGGGEQPVDVKVSGELSALDGRCPALSFTVGGARVATNGDTRFEGGACGDLRNGQRVEVEGARQGDGRIRARKVTREDAAPPADVRLEGAIGDLGGACPALTFRLGSARVATNSSTQFERGACGDLRNGQRVEVEGTRDSGGGVTARKVQRQR